MTTVPKAKARQSLAQPTRVAFYARVSTEEQAERDTSRNQVQYLQRKYAVDFLPDSPTPMELVGEFVDEGYSGALSLTERPESARLVDLARLKGVDAIIIYKLDRLGRTAKVLLEAHELFDQLGVAIISATEPFDTRTSIGRFVFQLLGSIAELERATIRDRMDLGRDRKARDGKFLNGPIPYGYDVDTDGRLTPSERFVPALSCSEADVARDILRRLAGGESGRGIARWLTGRGVPAHQRYRNKLGVEREKLYRDWAPDRVWRMANETLYRGLRVLDHSSGPIEQEVPALVDEVTWQRAHAQLGRNRTSWPKGEARLHLLAGRIRCGLCGRMMQGNYKVRQKRIYYGCAAAPGKGESRTGACLVGYFRGEPLEGLVLQEIDEFVANPGAALEELRDQLATRQGTQEQHEEQQRQLHDRLRDADEARRDVMALVKRRRITLTEADAQLEEIAEEVAMLRKDLESLDAQRALSEAMELQMLDTTRLLAEIREQWTAWREANDRENLREVVRQFLVEIRLHKDGSCDRVYAFGKSSTSAAQLHEHAAYVDETVRIMRSGVPAA